MLPPHAANPKGAPPVIKGQVMSTAYTVLGPKLLGYPGQVPTDKYPFHTNDMSAWLQAILEWGQHPQELVLAFRLHWRTIEYIVNDRKGRKQGRGSNVNTFTYLIGDDGEWKIDLNITTKSHQQFYMERVRNGDQERKARLYKIKPPLLVDPEKNNEIQLPVWQQDDHGWRYETMGYDEFISKGLNFADYTVQTVQRLGT